MSVRIYSRTSLYGVAVLLAGMLACAQPGGDDAGGIAIDPDDIGGTVTSTAGPEAGVWVIAETTELPTMFARVVVTDDQGRYVLPDLPAANYDVFVRGYGLVDSARVTAMPGQHLDLDAVVAPDGQAAAATYPPGSWLSLLEVPEGDIPTMEVVSAIKECLQCHAIGNAATREIPARYADVSSREAWDQRTSGGVFGLMPSIYARLGPQAQMFADWTDAIAAGAYPEQEPPRPAGLERNAVISVWDWATPEGTRSDAQATHEWEPLFNANGRVYGVHTNDTTIAWVDPQTNTVGRIETEAAGLRSSAIGGDGRVWATANPAQDSSPLDFCRPGSGNTFTEYFRMGLRGKQIVVYDPRTDEVEKIPTCMGVDHNFFGHEEDEPIYYGLNSAIGWLSTAVWDETHDPEAAQGWCPAVLDTNGDGVITEWTEPDEPVDPMKDHRIQFGCYSVAVSPHDGSLWCSGIQRNDNKLVRIERGDNPPESCMAEMFEPPELETPIFKTGGVALDSDGVAWLNWRGSDQVTSFDRRKCEVTNGPTATGKHCPEGWTVYQMDRPTFQGTEFPFHAEMMYLTQIDRHDVLGLGQQAVVTGPVNSNSLQVLVPDTGQFLDLVVAYPKGFFARSAQGRIDDPTAGWKGRGLWSNYSTYTPHFIEGGAGPKLVKFQMRPSPLDK